MNGITFSGLASGLDTSSIISQLVSLERIPIQQLESRSASASQRIDLIGTLKGNVEALRDKADELSSLSGFLSYGVEASQEGVANFTSTEGAIAGSHSLDILQLAAADRFAFQAVSDPDIAQGNGTISFSVSGNDYSVDASGLTLNEIAAAINTEAGEDVSASVVNTGTELAPQFRLVVASNQTGEDFAITGLQSTVGGLGVNGAAGSADNIAVAANAIALVDGLQVERSDNTFDGVVEGVSFEALAVTDGDAIQFSVSSDIEAVRTGVQEFVDAYNEVIDFINGQSQFTEDEGASGPLFGDSILRTVRSTIRDTLFNVDIDSVVADTEGYSTLNLVGISLEQDGRLTLDESTFDEKLAGNIDALADLFIDRDGFDNGDAEENTIEFYTDTTADTGLFDDLSRALDQILKDRGDGNGGTVKSIFSARTERLNETISGYNDQIERKERQIESFEESLVRRYAALEELLGALNAQGATINNFFSAQQNQ